MCIWSPKKSLKSCIITCGMYMYIRSSYSKQTKQATYSVCTYTTAVQCACQVCHPVSEGIPADFSKTTQVISSQKLHIFVYILTKILCKFHRSTPTGFWEKDERIHKLTCSAVDSCVKTANVCHPYPQCNANVEKVYSTSVHVLVVLELNFITNKPNSNTNSD